MEDGEDSEGPAPTGPGQHGVREVAGGEGRDQVWRSDPGENETSILELRGVGEDHAQDIVTVVASVMQRSETERRRVSRGLCLPSLAEDFGSSVHLYAVGRRHHDGSDGHEDHADREAFWTSPEIDQLDIVISTQSSQSISGSDIPSRVEV